MGYKFFDTIIKFEADKPLKSDRKHSEDKAAEFLNFINKGAKPISPGKLAEYHYYVNDKIEVGAYDEGFIISNLKLCNSLIFKDKVAKKILNKYQSAEIISVYVSETTNSVAFAQYKNGVQIRAFCCEEDDISMNKGHTEYDSKITTDEYGDALENWNIGLLSALNYYDSCFSKEIAEKESYENWNKSIFLWPYPGFLKRLLM